jgi:phosphotransferase system  glucose/maltose/N-acetylglucosamine-specific IIC component
MSDNMQEALHLQQGIGLVLGAMMIGCAVGLLLKKPMAYKATMYLSIGWMGYSLIMLLFSLVRHEWGIGWPVYLILVLYIVIYGGIFSHVRKSMPEYK